MKPTARKLPPHEWGPADQVPGPGFVRPEGDICEIPLRRRQRSGQCTERLLAKWISEGKLSAIHEEAAREIERAYVAISGPLMARAQNLDPDMAGPGTATTGHLEAFCDMLDRYKGWSAEMNGLPMVRGHNRRMVALDVIAEGNSLSDTDQKYRLRNGTVAEIVTDALRLYADLAGWANRKNVGGI